jgi:hypothetical protein
MSWAYFSSWELLQYPSRDAPRPGAAPEAARDGVRVLQRESMQRVTIRVKHVHGPIFKRLELVMERFKIAQQGVRQCCRGPWQCYRNEESGRKGHER